MPVTPWPVVIWQASGGDRPASGTRANPQSHDTSPAGPGQAAVPCGYEASSVEVWRNAVRFQDAIEWAPGNKKRTGPAA
ncbi:MAG: hypothetical protein OXC07_05060 [Kistimonas sp.]|nr:hypothetical protein [Kistimonas sp.]